VGVSCPKTADSASAAKLGWVHIVLEIFQTFSQLVATLLTLVVEIGALALRHALLIAWVAWWLCGVNWSKAWGVLAKGGWVVVALLGVIAALAWSALAPSTYVVLDVPVGNFWWQLGVVTMVELLALLCGWVQGVFGWAPAEINLQPAVETAAGHHGH
jgi:hypothetical protein